MHNFLKAQKNNDFWKHHWWDVYLASDFGLFLKSYFLERLILTDVLKRIEIFIKILSTFHESFNLNISLLRRIF